MMVIVYVVCTLFVLDMIRTQKRVIAMLTERNLPTEKLQKSHRFCCVSLINILMALLARVVLMISGREWPALEAMEWTFAGCGMGWVVLSLFYRLKTLPSRGENGQD